MYTYIKLRDNNTIIDEVRITRTELSDSTGYIQINPKLYENIYDIIGRSRYLGGNIVIIKRVLTKLDFIKLLTPAEYEEILVKAKTVFKVEKFKQTFDYAQDIDLDDQMVIDMLMGLIGEISGFDSTRINKILEG